MNTIQDYVESDQEREEGHVDTREHNFECEDKIPIWDVIWELTFRDKSRSVQYRSNLELR